MLALDLIHGKENVSDDKLDLKLNMDIDVHDLEKAKAVQEVLAKIDAELTAIGKHANESAKSLAMTVKAATGFRTRGSGTNAEGQRDFLAELKKTESFKRRMAAQAKAEQSDAARAAKAEADAVEERFKQQLAWNTRINRQREQANRDLEQSARREALETARIGDRIARKALADQKALKREQEQAARQVGRGAGQVRSGVGRAVTAGGATAAATAYAANRVVGDLTRSGVTLDKALNQNTRLSGLSPKDAEGAGQALVRKAAPIARSLGIKTAEYLAARAETIQAGVDESLVDAVTEYGSKYARLNDMNPSEVMESSGYGITALGAFGKVTAERVKSLFNVQQHLAATTAASRQGLSSFVRRGLSAGAAAGFDVEDTLAYGAAATSSGADGESAARMLSSTTERLASMPTRAAGIARKHHKSPKDALILALPGKLGFRSWSDLKQAYSKDAAGSIEKIYEGLAAITDPRARLEASEEIWGKEFGSVHAGMAVGHRFRDMRKSVRSKEAGNSIESGMAIRSGSFDFIMDQIGSTFQSLKDGLGMQLKPVWRDLRDWANLTPKAFESFDNAFREGISGFLTGLGSRNGTMAGLLKSWLGDPGSFTVNAATVGAFARGVGTGLREIGSAISSFVRLFAGQNASPEEIGKLTARILGLTSALVLAAPVAVIAGGFITAIGGIATAIMGAWRLLRGAGIVGGAAGTGAASAMWATAGRLIGVAFLAEIAQAFNVLKPDSKKGFFGNVLEEFVPAPLRRWLDSGSASTTNPTEESPAEKLKQENERQTQLLEEQLRVQKEALQLDKTRDLASKARTGGGTGQFLDSVHNPGPLNGSVGSGSSGGGGSGSGGGSGGSGGVPSIPDSVPMTATERNQLGLILQHESGGRNVMNGVGARRGVSPTAARGYTAQGYYQILNSNWRRIAPKLGINTPNAMASTFEEQTRVAHYLLRNGGIGNWSNFNPKLRAALARGDQAQFAPAGGGGGGATPSGSPVARAGESTGHLDGKISLEGETYDFGSGGHRGANSIPFGSHRITPGTIGPWGQSHGALGIAGNSIWDKTLGRMRTGIEFHAASSASKLSAGCIAIARGQYARFRAHVLDYVKRNGEAYLTVGADGRASITSAADRAAQSVAKTQDTAKQLGDSGAKGMTDGPKGLESKPTMRPFQGDPAAFDAKPKMGDNVPLRGSGARSLASGAASGGGQTSIHAPITIQGHNGDPKALANQVQRHLNDAMNRRSHDYNETWA